MTIAPTSSDVSVTIAVATYKRPILLEKLLISLKALVFVKNPNSDITIAIIDNDPEFSAREIVERHAADSPYPMEYFTEKLPGVTHVRNQALRLAADKDFLAFIDDDEMATPDWLDALLTTQSTTGATAVFGPVHPIYGQSPAPWIRDWGVHGRFMDVGGAQPKPGATCNCLIDMKVVRQEGLTFDPKMSLTGAEDTLFFSILLDRGYKFFRSPEALVHEHIPDDRAQPEWLLKRWYRTGLTDSIVAGRNSSEAINRVKAFLNGLIRFSIGGVVSCATAITHRDWRNRATMKRLYTACRGAGMISYAMGRSYEEYGRKKNA